MEDLSICRKSHSAVCLTLAKSPVSYLIKGIALCGLVFCVFVLKFLHLVVPQEVLETNYRLNRFVYTIPCDRYEENSGYQVCNGYIAIDNGGLFGVGIGNSTQKHLYLPESYTDFIFPVIVEELGLIVGIIILLIYAYIIYRILLIAKKTYSLAHGLICYGVAAYIFIHIFS